MLTVLVAAAAAFAYSKHETKKYSATATIVFNSQQLSELIAGLQTTLSGQAQQNSNVRLLEVGDMAEKTAAKVGRGLSASDVSAGLSVAQQGETSVVGESSLVDVTSTMASAVLAAEVANTYAKTFVSEQQQANRRYFASALAIVRRQLAALPLAQRAGTAGAALQSRVQALSLLAELQYGGVQIAQEASIASNPSSPRTLRNTLIGALLGLLVGIALVLLLERIDGRLDGPEDLARTYGAPLLGVVGDSPRLAAPGSGGSPGRLSRSEAEAFRMILAHMRVFNRNEPKVVLVTSAASGDGKTTFALRLAEAAATVGSRTLLVELDLRSPTLSAQLDLAPRRGASDVLNGAVSASEAISSIYLGESGIDCSTMPALDVMTAGTVRSLAPGQLLEGQTTELTFGWMSSTYDLVIVDAPMLTAVSDAYSLLDKVDGVIVVGTDRRQRRDVAESLRQILEQSGTRLLGVVANRVKRSATSHLYGTPDDSSQIAMPLTPSAAHSPTDV